MKIMLNFNKFITISFVSYLNLRSLFMRKILVNTKNVLFFIINKVVRNSTFFSNVAFLLNLGLRSRFEMIPE